MSVPVRPTASSHSVVWPITAGTFRLRRGFWAERLQLIRDVSVPHATVEMTQRGYVDNFLRRGGADVPFRGQPYTDSDLYKLLEAVAWLAPSDADEQPTAAWADYVAAAQDADGHLHTWFGSEGAPVPYSDLAMGHEMYCMAHAIQAGIAAHRAMGDDRMLAVARRAADHLVAQFADDPAGLCGHPAIEMALVELHRETGIAAYLQLARAMLDRRGHRRLGPGPFSSAYYQDDLPVREPSSFHGHCVRALYLACGMVDVYLETGDRSLLDAVVRQWQATSASKTHVTGGVGSRRKDEAFGASYELNPDRAFSETCAGVASFMCAWRLLLATGDAAYADAMERVLYNVLGASLSESGDRFRYVNTLHRRADAPDTGDKSMTRRAWFNCACCPPNLLRTVASLDAYVATTTDDGVQIHLYVDGVLETGHGHALDVTTDYPNSGRITITVLRAPAGSSSIGLRVPAWSTWAAVGVNGEAQPLSAALSAGVAVLRREWQEGDTVELMLDMAPRLLRGDHRVDGVRSCVAVQRGPVVYCLEDADLSGLRLGDVTVDEGAEPIDRGDGTVTVAGHHRPAAPPSWPYPPASTPQPAGTPIDVVLRPYHGWGNRGDGEMRVWLPVG